MPRLIKDRVGVVYGKLSVVSKATPSRNNHNHVMWRCKCECGNHVNVSGGNLQSGNTRSCGCTRGESDTNVSTKDIPVVLRDHPLVRVWVGIKRRAGNLKNYEHVSLHPGWEMFEGFLSDMGDTWENGMTIERIDNRLGYSPDNCRWTEMSNQPKNRNWGRDVIITEPDGTEVYIPCGFGGEYSRSVGWVHNRVYALGSGSMKTYKGYSGRYSECQIPSWLRPQDTLF